MGITGAGGRPEVYPVEQAVVGPVDGLPPGDDLQEEDAEGEDVRLLVHHAMHEVLRREVPARFRCEWGGCREDGKKKKTDPKVPSMEPTARWVHSDGSHLASPKSEIC